VKKNIICAVLLLTFGFLAGYYFDQDEVLSLKVYAEKKHSTPAGEEKAPQMNQMIETGENILTQIGGVEDQNKEYGSQGRTEFLEDSLYTIPGYAFNMLIDHPFDAENKLSADMISVMDLSFEEREKINLMLDEAMQDLRRMESASYVKTETADGSDTIFINSFKGQGAAVRERLLQKVTNELGEGRRRILEMQLNQHATILGEFGDRPLAIRYPKFAESTGNKEFIEVEIGEVIDRGTETERYQGNPVILSVPAFNQRFGHFFDVEVEK